MARLVLKFECRDALSAEEKQALGDAVERLEAVARGRIVVAEGDPQTSSRILVEGICARRKMLADGRQQITAVHLPGDFFDLHSFGLKVLDHDVVALTPARLAVVPHAALRKFTETLPHLARMLWLSTLLDAAMHREWLTSAGRRSALEHLGCFFCEIANRYNVVGIGGEGRWPFPLSQEELADVCGLTSVHINRTLQAIRQEDLADLRGGEIIVPDLDRLAAAVGFDPAYLHIGPRPQ
jgi:CRP-like cAMP-binding protein